MQPQAVSPNPAIDMIAIQSQFSSSIIENINVWLNVFDRDLNIVLWNATAEKLSGYSRRDVLGHNHIWECLYPDETYRKAVTALATAMLTKDRSMENIETEISCKDGQLKTISWHSKSLTDEQGRVYGAITFGYDITDRRRAREALQKANDELSVLYDIASVASASNDLHTILNHALDRVLSAMECKKGAVHLLQGKEGVLQLAVQRGLDPSIAAQLAMVPIEGGLIGRVLKQGEPLMVSDLANEIDYLKAVPPALLHSYLGVPIRAKGRVLGVFSFLGKAGREFRPEKVALLTSIAEQVGVAVENARLYQQAGDLAVVAERQRLARDLHDSVTQSLYSLTLFAETGRRLIHRRELDAAERYLQRLSETAQYALKEMRLLVYELRPLALERDGLLQTLQKRLDGVERRAGVKAYLIADAGIELPLAVERELYHIIQEALNNALKHAAATTVVVEIVTSLTQVHAKIIDDGVGFVYSEVVDQGGMGLVSMQERATKLGGTIGIISEPKEGTSISVVLELDARPELQPVPQPTSEVSEVKESD
ncbi:MAG: GAF domain-containing protein [Chloroflexi bacterium]|nr:GAF domain-containing protein [Chloroflexota bacterium]